MPFFPTHLWLSLGLKMAPKTVPKDFFWQVQKEIFKVVVGLLATGLESSHLVLMRCGFRLQVVGNIEILDGDEAEIKGTWTAFDRRKFQQRGVKFGCSCV